MYLKLLLRLYRNTAEYIVPEGAGRFEDTRTINHFSNPQSSNLREIKVARNIHLAPKHPADILELQVKLPCCHPLFISSIRHVPCPAERSREIVYNLTGIVGPDHPIPN